MNDLSLADLYQRVPAAEAWDLLDDLLIEREWRDSLRVWRLSAPLPVPDADGRLFVPDEDPFDAAEDSEVDDAVAVVQDVLGGEVL